MPWPRMGMQGSLLKPSEEKRGGKRHQQKDSAGWNPAKSFRHGLLLDDIQQFHFKHQGGSGLDDRG